MNLTKLRIAQKLPLLVIGSALVLGLSLGMIAYFQSAASVGYEVEKKLQVTQQARSKALSNYLNTIREDLKITSTNLMVVEALENFTAAWKEIYGNQTDILQQAYIHNNPNPSGQKEKLDTAGTGSTYDRVHAKYHPWFRSMLYTNEYYDVFLFDMEGNLVYSVFKELDYATNLQQGPWKSSGLGDIFRQAVQTLTPEHQAFVDFRPYAPSNDVPASFIGMPVFSGDQPIGVLAYQMPISRINALMQDSTGLGETGESYIVGDDYLMRSDSRFSKQSTILSRRVEIDAVKDALKGNEGAIVAEDYRGILVKSVYGPLQFMGTNWVVLAEIDEAEYFQPIADLRNSLFAIGGVLLIIVGAVGIFFARNIVKALLHITTSAKNLADGDLESEIPMRDRHDEVGDIARAVQIFQDNAIEMTRLENERLEREKEEERRQEEERKKIEEQLVIAAENMRIRVALDNCAANILVADVDGNVVYVNKALTVLFQATEADIRIAISGFSSSGMEGKSVNSLFSSETSQNQLIDSSHVSRTQQLKLGSRTFDLVYSPVIDEKGKFLGSTLEWQDLTLELRTQDEIDDLVNAIVSGDFSKTVSLEGKQGFMRKLAEAMNQINLTINSVIDDVGASLAALSSGDLSHRITTDYVGTYDKLKRDSNQTSEKLMEIVSQIIDSSSQISHAAKEINSGSTDLSQRTENQAANLEETAAAMEELATTVQQTAENAQQANKLAIAAYKVAENGGDVVNKSIEAMSAIEESSQKVSEIIGVINEIAFQTNLLALNASVEAARAGDAGKGFAVVAAEVGTLAQRTATAAKDVKNLITNSDNQIRGGVELTNDTGKALSEIVESIKNVTEIIGDITDASDEQSRGIQETNTAIASMDEMTQQNAALVQESLSAAEAMQSQANSLDELIRFFELENETAYRKSA